MVSLPSPGSQTKVSLPAPSRAGSLPPLPSIVSFPLPPSSVSTPLPPAMVSFPFPPSIVVGMLSVKAPLLSSTRTASSPARALTTIFVIALRGKLKSAEPSSPTSIWRMSGWPACRRRAILSLPFVPLTLNRPCLSFGRWNLADLGGYEYWAGFAAGAAFAASATIPVAPAAATTAAKVASHTGRTLRFLICAFLLSSEPIAAR